MQYHIERVTPTLCRFCVSLDEKLKANVRHAATDRTLGPGHEKAAYRAAVMEQLMDGCVPEVLQQAGILPLTPIRILPEKHDSGKEECFSFEVETLPELDLPDDLSMLSVDVEEPLPDPREFSHAALQIQRSRAILIPVKEKRLPQNGDILRLNITAFAHGKELPDMRHDDFSMTLSPVKDSLSEVEILARSLYAGETKQCSVLCPSDYPDPSLRGRNLTLQVELVSICTEQLPPFNETLAAQMGFSSLKKLKDIIFDHIMGEKIRNIQSRAHKRLLDALLQNKNFPIPPAIMALNRHDCEQEARVFFRRQKKSDEEIRHLLKRMERELFAQAENRSRMQVLLLAVAVREKLHISQQEADRQLRRMAEQAHKNYDTLHDAVYKSRLIYDLQLRLLTAKALQLLYKKVKKTVVDSTGTPIPVPAAHG